MLEGGRVNMGRDSSQRDEVEPRILGSLETRSSVEPFPYHWPRPKCT